MRVDEERVGDVTILRFAGEFDAHTLPVATEKLDDLFKIPRSRLVFNIGGLTLIASSGLSFFIDAVRRAKALDGAVVLSEPTRLFESSVRALDIPDYFTVFPNDGEALAHFDAAG